MHYVGAQRTYLAVTSAAIVLILGLTGCTSAENHATGITGATSPSVTTPLESTSGGSGAPSFSPSGSAVARTLTFADSGHSLTLAAGELLRVELDTTFWSFPPPADPNVLTTAVAPAASPAPSCIPGGGCGTTTVTYRAMRAGRTTITATRTSCGEAEGCTASSGVFAVTIVVT